MIARPLAIAAVLLCVVALASACGDDSGAADSATPGPTVTVAATTPFHTVLATIPPVTTPTPTATAPAACGFGSGLWEQCAKTAIDPALTAFLTTYHSAPNSTAVWEYYTEWPDSCLAVEQAGVACPQVVTPGYRVLLTGGDSAAARLPYVEYHTDLAGAYVFVTEYADLPDWATEPSRAH